MDKELRIVLRPRASLNFAEDNRAENMSFQLHMILLLVALYLCSTVEASHCPTNGKFLFPYIHIVSSLVFFYFLNILALLCYKYKMTQIPP